METSLRSRISAWERWPVCSRHLGCFHDSQLCRVLQVYPVLSTEEASSVDDAAVKLLMDWVDHRPEMPEDPAIHAQYRKDMSRGANHACKLLEALCTKRTALIERLWSLYLEEDQDEFVKACCCEYMCFQPCYALQLQLRVLHLVQLDSGPPIRGLGGCVKSEYCAGCSAAVLLDRAAIVLQFRDDMLHSGNTPPLLHHIAATIGEHCAQRVLRLSAQHATYTVGRLQLLDTRSLRTRSYTQHSCAAVNSATPDFAVLVLMLCCNTWRTYLSSRNRAQYTPHTLTVLLDLLTIYTVALFQVVDMFFIAFGELHCAEVVSPVYVAALHSY